MHVLVVTTWLPTEVAPRSGIFVQRDIELLAQDHQVDVIHLAPGGTTALPSENWTTRTVAMKPSDPLSILKAGRALKNSIGGYDLIHTMAASTLLPFARLQPCVPWVHTEHWSGILSPQTEPWAARLTLPVTLRLFARPDVVVAVGSELARAIQARRAGTVQVIPNEVERPAVLVERDCRDGRVRMVAVGGLISRKDPELAVRTCAELVRRGCDASLTWVGEGPLHDRCVALAAELGISERVRFVGSLPTAGVLEELGSADVFVLPTRGETFGVAIAEALASGRPVVVGADGGHREFVQGSDGVLVSGRTPEAYADGVERILDLNRGRSAEQIARFVSTNFTDERRRELYADAYAAALAQLKG